MGRLVQGRVILSSAAIALFAVMAPGCAPVGSDEWCAKLDDKPKGEWTIEEAGDYTKYCVLGMDPQKWCEKMEEKDKGDWTAKEAADYAANCVVGRNR